MNSAIAHTNDPGKKNGNSMQINWEGKDILAQANAMPKSIRVHNRKNIIARSIFQYFHLIINNIKF